MKKTCNLCNEKDIYSFWINVFTRLDFDGKYYAIKATKYEKDGTGYPTWCDSSDFKNCGEGLLMTYFFEMLSWYDTIEWHESHEHFFRKNAKTLSLDMQLHDYYWEVYVEEICDEEKEDK